jgi:hypothetical protein
MMASYLGTRRCSRSESGWQRSAQTAQGQLELETGARLPHDQRKQRWLVAVDSGSELRRCEGHSENSTGK